MVTVQGESRSFVNNVFVVGSCTPIVGADVRCFDTEREMMTAYSKFIVEVDPDVIIGYNIMNFDFPFLFDRAQALKLKDFKMMSRLANDEVRVKSTTFSSKAYGTRESHDICTFGLLRRGSTLPSAFDTY
jgi:DNA polymerase delta subunit 1